MKTKQMFGILEVNMEFSKISEIPLFNQAFLH